MEKVEKFFDEKPWELEYVPVDELKAALGDACKNYTPKNNLAKLAGTTAPEKLRDTYMTIVLHLIDDNADPVEFTKEFDRAVICRMLNEDIYQYYVDKVLDQSVIVIDKLPEIREAYEIYKNIDWTEVRRFIEKVDSEKTFEAYWLNRMRYYGASRVEKEIRKVFETFDEEFLSKLSKLINAIQSYGIHYGLPPREELDKLWNYNPDALNVNEFIKRLKERSMRFTARCCPCFIPCGGVPDDHKETIEEKVGEVIDYILEEYGDDPDFIKKLIDALKEIN